MSSIPATASGPPLDPGERLNVLLAEAGLPLLPLPVTAKFESYLALLLYWNQRVNLTAIRDEDSILKRHFVESIACAFAIPAGVGTLLDLGSGGGFPGIPIALCRPEILVTLAESQGKKAAFLQEALRTLELRAAVHAARAEGLTVQFDCVAMRAVDRMLDSVRIASGLVAPDGWLAVLTTQSETQTLRDAAGLGYAWSEGLPLPFSTDRLLLFGKRV